MQQNRVRNVKFFHSGLACTICLQTSVYHYIGEWDTRLLYTAFQLHIYVNRLDPAILYLLMLKWGRVLTNHSSLVMGFISLSLSFLLPWLSKQGSIKLIYILKNTRQNVQCWPYIGRVSHEKIFPAKITLGKKTHSNWYVPASELPS